MKNMIMMIGIGWSIAVCAMSPLASAAKQNSSSNANVPLVLAFNDDQLAGKWKQFKGEIKKKWGNFTDGDLLYIKGSRDKLEGKIQERYGDRREEVKKWIDDWFEQNNSEKLKHYPNCMFPDLQ